MRNTEAAFKYQELVLSKLAQNNFEQLHALLGRKELPSPQELDDFSFAQEISEDEHGGLEVNVFHYFYLSEKEKEEIVKYFGKTPDNISIGESRMCRWFNILPNNKIEWPDMEYREGED